MSEHIHRFELKPWEDKNECADCGSLAIGLVVQMQQQLAEAKERDEQCIAHHAGHHQQEERLHAKIARQEEELRILAAQRQDYKAQAAEARALLERVAGTDEQPEAQDGDCDVVCFFCSGEQDYDYKPPEDRPYNTGFNHRPDCFWLAARAFLQKQSG